MVRVGFELGFFLPRRRKGETEGNQFDSFAIREERAKTKPRDFWPFMQRQDDASAPRVARNHAIRAQRLCPTASRTTLGCRTAHAHSTISNHLAALYLARLGHTLKPRCVALRCSAEICSSEQSSSPLSCVGPRRCNPIRNCCFAQLLQ